MHAIADRGVELPSIDLVENPAQLKLKSHQ
jgi:hypothetical protein